MIRRLFLLITFGATATLGLGCGSFDRDWRALTETPPPHADITGPWAGSWESDYNAHTGGLRAIITDNEDGTYHVRYHATYGELVTLTYTYDLDMQVTRDDDGLFHFSGEADLGWFGIYTHDGHATPNEFFAEYEADRSDFGTYRMTRPQQVAE